MKLKIVILLFCACIINADDVGQNSSETFEVGKSVALKKLPKLLARDKSKEVVTDAEVGLMWQDNADAKTVKRDWQGAIDYCENLSFAGFEDWRLPQRLELQSITDKTKAKPAIKSRFVNVESDYYWSASSGAGDSGTAWGINFDGGYTGIDDINYEYYVRCVRESTSTLDSFSAVYEWVLGNLMDEMANPPVQSELLKDESESEEAFDARSKSAELAHAAALEQHKEAYQSYYAKSQKEAMQKSLEIYYGKPLITDLKYDTANEILDAKLGFENNPEMTHAISIKMSADEAAGFEESLESLAPVALFEYDGINVHFKAIKVRYKEKEYISLFTDKAADANATKAASWRFAAENCYAQISCKNDETGLTAIDDLIKAYESFSSDLRTDQELYQNLIHKKNEIEFWVHLEETETLDAVDKFINNYKELSAVHAGKVKERLRFVIEEEIDMDKYAVENDLQKVIASIKDELRILGFYEKLTESLNGCANSECISKDVDFENFKKLTSAQQEKIKNNLKERYSAAFKNEVANTMPKSTEDQAANRSWMKEYEAFKTRASISSIGFVYAYAGHKEHSSAEERVGLIKQLSELEKNGISSIRVSVKGNENNTLHFGCGMEWTGSREEIIIEGFSLPLNYKEKLKECVADTVIFKELIALHADKEYSLTLIEENKLGDLKLKANLSFSLQELYALDKNETLVKKIDADKIELHFFKSGQE